jgi:hypothetical protein
MRKINNIRRSTLNIPNLHFTLDGNSSGDNENDSWKRPTKGQCEYKQHQALLFVAEPSAVILNKKATALGLSLRDYKEYLMLKEFFRRLNEVKKEIKNNKIQWIKKYKCLNKYFLSCVPIRPSLFKRMFEGENALFDPSFVAGELFLFLCEHIRIKDWMFQNIYEENQSLEYEEEILKKQEEEQNNTNENCSISILRQLLLEHKSDPLRCLEYLSLFNEFPS